MVSPEIERYRFGRITVDGQDYTRDLIITPGGVTENWWRIKGHSLALEDLAGALEAKPEVLVIGQGSFGQMKVPAETLEHLEKAGIEVIVQPTGAACEAYNRTREYRRTVAALHLTC